MDLSKAYMDDFLVGLSHHSNAIENNKVTLSETVSIILHNTVPNKVSLRELYEIDNHRYAMEYLLSPDTLKETFTFDVLFDTHAILMDRFHHERGTFKTEINYIKGADFDTAHADNVFIMMKQWLSNVKYRLELTKSDKEVIDLVCESHVNNYS